TGQAITAAGGSRNATLFLSFPCMLHGGVLNVEIRHSGSSQAHVCTEDNFLTEAVIFTFSTLPLVRWLELLPRLVRIELRHRLHRRRGVGPEVFLIDHSVVVHDEGHDPG